MVHDITQRKQAEQALAQARLEAERRAAELESFMRSIAEGVGLFDAEGHLLFANDAVRQIVGAPAEAPLETWAKSVTLRYLDGQPIPIEQYPSWRALRGETLKDNRYIASSPWKELVASITAAPVRDSEGAVIGATVVWRDIGEQTKFERQKDEMLEREHHIAEVFSRRLSHRGCLPRCWATSLR